MENSNQPSYIKETLVMAEKKTMLTSFTQGATETPLVWTASVFLELPGSSQHRMHFDELFCSPRMQI